MRIAPFAWVIAALLAVSTPSSALAQDGPPPELTLGQEAVLYGDQLQVRGTGFPPGALAHIELCGNAALDATADCDVRGATEYAIRDTGELFAVVGVRALPQPCPCVVRVTLSGGGREFTAPIQVPEAGFVTATERIPVPGRSGGLEITSLRLTGGGGLAALVGAAQDRTARLELTNTGSTTVRAPAVALTFGRGDDPTGILSVPSIQDIAPGSTVAVEVPVSVDPLSFGAYTLRASVDGPGEPAVARTSLTTYPWALFAAALVLVQLVLLRLRNRVRRRIASSASSDDDGAPPPGADASDVDGDDHADERAETVSPGAVDAVFAARDLDALPPTPQPEPPTRPDPFVALELAVSSLLAASGTTAQGQRPAIRASDLATVASTTAADEVGAAVERLEDRAQVLRDRMADAEAQIVSSLATAETSVARVVERVESAADVVLGQLAAARQRADELVAQGEREVAAALADVDEAMRAERDAADEIRHDASTALRRLEAEVADVLAQAQLVAKTEIAEVSTRATAVLAEIQEVGAVPAGNERTVDEPEVAQVIDLRAPRAARERAAEAPTTEAPRDGLSEAIRRAVQRSLSG